MIETQKHPHEVQSFPVPDRSAIGRLALQSGRSHEYETLEKLEEKQIVSAAIDRYAKKVMNGGQTNIESPPDYGTRLQMRNPKHPKTIQRQEMAQKKANANLEKLERNLAILESVLLPDPDSERLSEDEIADKFGVKPTTVEKICDDFKLEIFKERVHQAAMVSRETGTGTDLIVFPVTDELTQLRAMRFAENYGLQAANRDSEGKRQAGVVAYAPVGLTDAQIENGEKSYWAEYNSIELPQEARMLADGVKDRIRAAEFIDRTLEV